MWSSSHYHYDIATYPCNSFLNNLTLVLCYCRLPTRFMHIAMPGTLYSLFFPPRIPFQDIMCPAPQFPYKCWIKCKFSKILWLSYIKKTSSICFTLCFLLFLITSAITFISFHFSFPTLLYVSCQQGLETSPSIIFNPLNKCLKGNSK